MLVLPRGITGDMAASIVGLCLLLRAGCVSRHLIDSIYEMYVEWCRLNGYGAPKHGIEAMIDEATGFEDAKMQEFCEWLRDEVFSRMPTDLQRRDSDG